MKTLWEIARRHFLRAVIEHGIETMEFLSFDGKQNVSHFWWNVSYFLVEYISRIASQIWTIHKDVIGCCVLYAPTPSSALLAVLS